jgi:hypothetical protein
MYVNQLAFIHYINILFLFDRCVIADHLFNRRWIPE